MGSAASGGGDNALIKIMMKKIKNKKLITIFEGQKIRRHWDEEKEKWYAVVQTLYLPDWNRRQPYLKNWYKHKS